VPEAASPSPLPFRRVEHHMSTAITLAGRGLDDAVADRFFTRIAALEAVLSRFRPDSDVSRLARGECSLDDVDPAMRTVLASAEALRALTGGDFEHEPQRASGRPEDPPLDVNAYAKGWIIEEAATVLRLAAAEFFVNAGGDILASARAGGTRWRVGVQHPTVRTAVLGTFGVAEGAVATSGAYERGAHIRLRPGASLISVTVVGPELGEADGLATAVFASGHSPPPWWEAVSPAFGLLTLSSENKLRWIAPRAGDRFEWTIPPGSS